MRLEETAQIIARIVHRDQMYGGYPYTVHLSAVVNIIKRYDTNPYVIAAGWLHDAPEDTFYDVKWIERDLGTQTAQLVDVVTGRGSNRKEKQANILIKLRIARPEASLIKAADRIANVLFALRSEDAGLTKMYLNEANRFCLVVAPKIPPGLHQELIAAHQQADEWLQSIALTPTPSPL